MYKVDEQSWYEFSAEEKLRFLIDHFGAVIVIGWVMNNLYADELTEVVESIEGDLLAGRLLQLVPNYHA